MRLLLIAYEFPPSSSPQSLRWAYLCRELHALGHEVHVLTIDLGGTTPGLPELPRPVRVHRTFAGPIRGALVALRDRSHRRASLSETRLDAARGSDAVEQAIRPPRSGKQSFSETAQRLAAQFVFPDVRGEWFPWGKSRLNILLGQINPDLVISSHEPATTLELGLLAKQKGFPLIADLGDPVLAPYTPKRWAKRAHLLEQEICKQADHIIVTNTMAAAQMKQRHGREHNVSVLTQGFPETCETPSSDIANLFSSSRLELLYTGSFYQFRKPDALIDALSQCPHARLNIASVTVPESLLAAADMMPQQIRLLGFLPHQHVLTLQRGADLLVNIANDDPHQIPGKIYEYLGACRPILHLGSFPDAIANLIAKLNRGWYCENASTAITQRLDAASQLKRSGSLNRSFALDLPSVRTYSWKHTAEKLDSIARETLDGRI